jgi:hypothetical protein
MVRRRFSGVGKILEGGASPGSTRLGVFFAVSEKFLRGNHHPN